MTREKSAQQGPPINLKSFPSFVMRRTAVLYRSVSSAWDEQSGGMKPRGFGWHSSDGSGRFDLRAPAGTMYLAFSRTTALKERILAPVAPKDPSGLPLPPLVQRGCMSRAQAERIFIWSVCPLRQPPIADLAGKRADTHFGVTNELSGGTGNYALAQDWAAALHKEEFGGLRYKSRFDSEAAPDAFALAAFNDQGGATEGWFVSSQAEAEPASSHIQALGITLVDPPIKPATVVGL